MKLTYDAILNDPSLLERTLAAARRERAVMIHRVLFAPIAALLVRTFKTTNHAAHPHLARQG